MIKAISFNLDCKECDFMKNEGAVTTAKTKTEETNKPEALTTTSKTLDEGKADGFKPMLVKAEKMFERLADITRETAHKAYEIFQRRGGEFGRELDDWFRAESEVLLPVKVEITETDDQINVRAAVPGFKPEDIEVSVKDNILILSGETESSEKREDENMVFSEFRSNKFCRQLTLSSEVDEEKVAANLKEGVLQLTLPKVPAKEATNVPVNAT
jgi:HSP20 family protein